MAQSKQAQKRVPCHRYELNGEHRSTAHGRLRDVPQMPLYVQRPIEHALTHARIRDACVTFVKATETAAVEEAADSTEGVSQG